MWVTNKRNLQGVLLNKIILWMGWSYGIKVIVRMMYSCSILCILAGIIHVNSVYAGVRKFDEGYYIAVHIV
ncbi:hypothetical protein M3P05_12330, partial [Sansalvadorimonas sp. 2012CJ34-2]